MVVLARCCPLVKVKLPPFVPPVRVQKWVSVRLGSSRLQNRSKQVGGRAVDLRQNQTANVCREINANQLAALLLVVRAVTCVVGLECVSVALAVGFHKTGRGRGGCPEPLR